MSHCVASYDLSCAFHRTSIWSLGVESNLGRRKRLLTIEAALPSRVICQIRGKANRLPDQQEIQVIRRWAAQERLSVAGCIPGLVSRN
jgi:hypothetical protein